MIAIGAEAVAQRLRDRGLLHHARSLADDCHVTLDEMLGRSRLRHIAEARRLWWVALRARGFSYPAIGSMVGRDHSTVQQVVTGKSRQ